MRVTQEMYAGLTLESRNRMAKALQDPALAQLILKARAVPPHQWSLDNDLIKAAGRAYMKALIKAGVTTGLGFNFYDLRGPAYMQFPINTPFIQMIPKTGKVNAGVGTVAHWKATRNPNSTYVYGGVSEGKRNATATPDENDYFATYKETGMEGGETFTAQWAGEGYTDNLADEHFRNLARLRLQEEMLTMWGNSGPSVLNGVTTGNLGLSLGQPVTPTLTRLAGTSGNFGNGANICAAVVAITPMGYNPGGQAGYGATPSVAHGLTTVSTRTNADGSTDTINGGTSQVSNVCANSITNATAQTFTVSTTAIKGAVAYAWFWGVNTTAAHGNLKLGAITSCPTYTISDAPAGSYLDNSSGLDSDHSYNTLDFDGLGTYAWNQGLWTDMNGGSFSSAGNGQVSEVESDLQYLWTNYQAQPDAIWVSADVRAALESAIIYSSTGTNSYIFQYTKDTQGGLLGGFLVTAYKSKYSINPEGGAAIPIRLHPMMPPGTMMYDVNTNPYPHSRTPGVRSFLLQRDYYAIEWPVVTRQWTFGTYIHQVLAHYYPWITAIRTGIGSFVKPS